jgi:hypothetical protein
MKRVLRPPPPHELEPSHTQGELVGRAPGQLGPSRYKQIQQILIGGIIIGIVGLMMINAFYKARRPAYMADCMGRLHSLGQALEMYSADHGMRLPPGASWRYAASPYMDQLGGVTEGIEQARRLARPRGFSGPMRCLANRSTNPISYFYLDPTELGYQRLDEPDLPVLVDETNHPKVIILQSDWSCRTTEGGTWANERRTTLQIARRSDWSDTFAYVSTRPPPPPAPELAPWERPVGPPPWQAEAATP